MRRTHGAAIGGMVVVALATLAQPTAAQQRPARGGQTIEIRGQVPTPQVVTVRPRTVPVYRREAMADELDRSFRPAPATAYRVVSARELTGGSPVDVAVGDSGGAPAAGASAADIEAMRRELATHRSRLDSLERAERPADASLPRPSAADSAARAAEIRAIRRELELRRARLDSLETLVRGIGRRGTAPADSAARPRRTP